jgi:hypothetical protein
MKRFGTAVLCLLALGSLAAVAAASAVAAEPAIYECGKAKKETVKYIVNGKEKSKSVYTGRYTEKKCVTLAPAGKYRAEGKPEGKYELQEGIGKGKPFKGAGKGANLNAAGIGGVSCTGSSDTGKFTSPTSAGEIVAKFKGCEFNGLKCTNTAVLGEIVTNPLVGGIGYIAGKGTKTPTVGTDLKPESGEVLAEFHCQNVNFAVTGSVIGEILPVNKFTKVATFVFASVGSGVQKYEKFEEGLPDTLKASVCTGCPAKTGVTVPASEETIVVNKGEELMLKA